MKQGRPGRMRLKASDKTSCLALRCGGPSLGGDQRHGVSGKGRDRGPQPPCRVRRAGMVTMRDRHPQPRRVRALRGPGPRCQKGQNPERMGCLTAGKEPGGLGCGGDPAPAPQLLFTTLTSAGASSLAPAHLKWLASSCCGVPANSIALGQRAATIY